MSNEHVIRKSIQKLIDPGVEHWFGRVQGAPVPEDARVIKRHVPRPLHDLTVNKVCKECNEGWLNLAVEHPAEETLNKLIQGAETRIGRHEARRLALWATKTAFVRGVSEVPDEIARPDLYEYLRVHLRPPAGVRVWICRQAFYRGWNRHTIDVHENDNGRYLLQAVSLSLGHVFILIAGEFPLATFIPPAHHLLAGAQPILPAPPDMIQIWPYKAPIHWPSGRVLLKAETVDRGSILMDFVRAKWADQADAEKQFSRFSAEAAAVLGPRARR